MDWLLPRTGGCCIHICIKIGSFYCDIKRWTSCTHWSQGHHPILPNHKKNHGELTLWNTVNWQLWNKFGAPTHSKWCIRNIWYREIIIDFSSAPRVEDARSMDQELPDHRCQVQVKGFQLCIHFKRPRWWICNVICYFKMVRPDTKTQYAQTSNLS